ncbi:secreted protein [Bathymodiolus azoricus thioautotrophic gill symbiont]|uniref:Secreted protein n=1 Tax=Bathymodiolus azoricus thioautotrophic gill symbiont TaxID=235205 RepID=A0A1H6K6L8_9GAMM|nr:secreted protein [Bathymodiolus azoricus thioautotrophic gill symbiont]
MLLSNSFAFIPDLLSVFVSASSSSLAYSTAPFIDDPIPLLVTP